MKAWREGGSWAALCVDREAVEEEEGGKKPAGWAGTWEGLRLQRGTDRGLCETENITTHVWGLPWWSRG